MKTDQGEAYQSSAVGLFGPNYIFYRVINYTGVFLRVISMRIFAGYSCIRTSNQCAGEKRTYSKNNHTNIERISLYNQLSGMQMQLSQLEWQLNSCSCHKSGQINYNIFNTNESTYAVAFCGFFCCSTYIHTAVWLRSAVEFCMKVTLENIPYVLCVQEVVANFM